MDQSYPNKWLIFSLVAVGIFMSTLDGSIVNIALPTIMKDFSTPLATIEWVMMIYLLTVSSLLLSFGRLSDIVGRRSIYFTGLLIFSAGSLFCALSGGAYILIASRSFQGLGAAMIMASTPALIVDTFPIEERGRALGLIGAVVASGLTTGPFLGGTLLHFFTWRSIFFINIPIGLICSFFVFILLRKSRADYGQPDSFDWAGAIILTIATGTLLIAVTNGYEWGYSSFKFIGMLCIFCIALLLFIIIELNVKSPVLDLSLFKIRLFSLPLISAVTLFITLFTMIFLMPFYLMFPRGFSTAQTGYIMVIPFALLFIVSPVSGALSDRIGSKILCTIGMFIVMAALMLLSQLTPDSTAFSIGWRLALIGLGTSVFISPNSAAVMTAVPPSRRGVTGGIVAAARNLGMVLGVAFAGAIFNQTFHTLSGGLSLKAYTEGLEDVFMISYRNAMLFGAFAAFTGMVLSFLRGPEQAR